jgi:anti-sigma-K factor RskA
MNQDHDLYLDSIPSYVLGALDDAELAALEAHLETNCAECNAEMLRASRDLEALAAANTPVVASTMTRARLMAKIDNLPPAQPVLDPARADRRGVSWLPLAAAATLVVLAWSGWTQLDLRRQLNQLTAQRAADQQQLVALRSDLDRAQYELGRFALTNRILAAPGLQTVRLAGLDAAPQASAQALVSSVEGKAVFYASNLEPQGPDKTYQLWIIAGGKPISAGTFELDDSGGGALVVENLGTDVAIEAWAVTIEPAGGVPQPTGPMVLMGSAA